MNIDTTERNWWRDLNADDFDNAADLEFLSTELSRDMSRIYIELADIKVRSEQGEAVDADWHRSLVTVFEYAKDKRKQFARRGENLNRQRATAERKLSAELQERTLAVLARVEAMLERAER